MPFSPGTNFPVAVDTPESLILTGNGLVTTLAANLAAGATTCTVADAANWPTKSIATIQKRVAVTVGSETVYLPTGALEIVNFERSGNTLTLTRAQQATIDIPHDAGDYIECRITALHHDVPRDAIVAIETYLLALKSKWIFGETPTGLVNGSNAAFQSAFDFVPESVVVLVNGVEQRRVTDFNTSGTRTITLTEAPNTGEAVRINYIIP